MLVWLCVDPYQSAVWLRVLLSVRLVKEDVLQQQNYCSYLPSCSSFLPLPQGGDSKQGQIAFCCSCVWKRPVESEVTMSGLVKNKARLVQSQTAPGAMVHRATSHRSHTIRNDKCPHQLLSQVSNPRLMLLPQFICRPLPQLHNHLLSVSHFSSAACLISVIVKVKSRIEKGHKRLTQ